MEIFVSITYILTAAVLLLFLKPALTDRHQRDNQAFILFILAVASYAIFEATNLFVSDNLLSVVLQKATITAGIFIGIAWLSFAVAFSDTYSLSRKYLIAVGLYAGITVFATWLNSGHLIIGPQADVLDTLFWPDPQVGFFLLLGGAYLQIILGTGMFGLEVFTSANLRRKQAGLLALAIVPAMLGSLGNAYVLTTNYVILDFTIYGFAISGTVFAAAMYSGRFLDIKPIARRTVVNDMAAAVITIDDADRVVDCNPSAKALCNVSTADIGLPATAFFNRIDIDIAAILEKPDDFETVVSIDTDGETRYFEVSVTGLDGSGPDGRIVILRDITTQKVREKHLQEQKSKLEDQNERLDQFASVASHDLQAPITIAGSYLHLAKNGDEPTEALDEIESALHRAETLIEELLDIARQGTAFESESVHLDQIAHQAWAAASTGDASLVVETDAAVTADQSHLLRLFENLFRNSIEHGDSNVTVRVGTTSQGFFVADDGAGIPESKRDEIFDIGVTHNPDGTGYGLAIVHNIVDGHEWEIEVGESENGGARFDITGVAFSSS